MAHRISHSCWLIKSSRSTCAAGAAVGDFLPFRGAFGGFGFGAAAARPSRRAAMASRYSSTVIVRSTHFWRHSANLESNGGIHCLLYLSVPRGVAPVEFVGYGTKLPRRDGAAARRPVVKVAIFKRR